jgi:hypothetical protein
MEKRKEEEVMKKQKKEYSPLFGPLEKGSFRVFDPLWNYYRFQELFEVKDCACWSPIDYFFSLQRALYKRTGKWGVAYGSIYWPRHLLEKEDLFKRFPNLEKLFIDTTFNMSSSRRFQYLRLMTGFYNFNEIFDSAWGLVGSSSWPIQYYDRVASFDYYSYFMRDEKIQIPGYAALVNPTPRVFFLKGRKKKTKFFGRILL